MGFCVLYINFYIIFYIFICIYKYLYYIWHIINHLNIKINIMKAITLNANTEAQGIELLKELGSVEFEKRNEVNKSGDNILKVVGMDSDFEILGYAIVELN